MKNIAIVLGTRPEIIKLAGIIRELENKKANYYVFDTKQQLTENMKENFYRMFKINEAKILYLNNNNDYNNFGKINELIKLFAKHQITDVIVQGDTNSVLWGTIASTQLNLKLHHVEAGLRSYDYRMREEYNRIITDSVSDYLYAPTIDSFNNLKFINAKQDSQSFVTGNTVVDAIEYIILNHKLLKSNSKNDYLAMTLHRAENVDNKQQLKVYLKYADEVGKKLKKKIIFFVHPRTLQKIVEFNIKIKPYKNIVFYKPINYFQMINELMNCYGLLTDSGGLIEESTCLNIPSIILRKTSERMESVSAGYSLLGGLNPGVEKGINFLNKFNKEKEIKKVNPYITQFNGKRIFASNFIVKKVLE